MPFSKRKKILITLQNLAIPAMILTAQLCHIKSNHIFKRILSINQL